MKNRAFSGIKEIVDIPERRYVLMFCKNESQQTTMMDPILTMPQYLLDILRKSWAHTIQKRFFLTSMRSHSLFYIVIIMRQGQTRPSM